MILILSNKWDVTVDFVVKELRQRKHPFLRLNTEDLVSMRATITLPNLHISLSKQEIVYDLTKTVHVIWNRRPGNHYDDVPIEDRPSIATQRFVNNQWFSWLEVLQLIPDVTWINHPNANSFMENKVRQLQLASEIGFRIPITIISNDPENARVNLEKFGGRMIAKALYSPLIEEQNQDYFIFTNEITEISQSDDEHIRLSPCIFQEPITPKVDYRVTVIGETAISVRIESENNIPLSLDWRTQKEKLRFIPCSIPNDVEHMCLNYVKQNGLLFGAIDLVKHNDEFVFLEINPNGEWGWLQKPYGISIAETLCNLMIIKDWENYNHNKYG